MGKDKDKETSLVRSKQSLISLADLLMQEGLSNIPGGSSSYKLVKLLAKHVGRYIQTKRESRIYEFHEKIIDGIPPEHHDEFLKTKFSVEDYYALLERAVQDEEDQKVEIYAKLFQGLVLGQIPQEFRLHFIKATRELTYADFNLMRVIYIHAKYDLKAPGNFFSPIYELTKTTDPMRAYAIQTLIRLGFLLGKDGNTPPQTTSLLTILVEFLYDRESLTPEAIGKKAKTATSEMVRVFIAYGDSRVDSGLLQEIEIRLFNSGIKSCIATPTKRSFPLTIAPIVVLCVSQEGSPIEDIRKNVNLQRKVMVAILMSGAKRGDLPSEVVATFDLTKAEKKEVDRLVDFIKTQLGE